MVAQLVKNPPAMRESWVQSLGWEDPLEKGKATHSSILAYTVHGATKSWLQLSEFYFPFNLALESILSPSLKKLSKTRNFKKEKIKRTITFH